jgi:hypothetical protein
VAILQNQNQRNIFPTLFFACPAFYAGKSRLFVENSIPCALSAKSVRGFFDGKSRL